MKEVLDNWGVAEKVIACRFDTTSANTGVHKGSCVLLQNLLQRLLLWLACRHHVLELVLAAAFIELFGVTTGPEVTLFKTLSPGSPSTRQTCSCLQSLRPTPVRRTTSSSTSTASWRTATTSLGATTRRCWSLPSCSWEARSAGRSLTPTSCLVLVQTIMQGRQILKFYDLLRSCSFAKLLSLVIT